MINRSELENFISAASWPQGIKNQLLAVSSSAGRYTLQFLWDSVHEFGANLVLGHLAVGMQKASAAKAAFVQGNSVSLLSLLQRADEDQATDFGSYLLPIVLETLEAVAKTERIEERKQLADFLYQRFPDIYPEALQRILHDDISLFLENPGILMQFERWYAEKWRGVFGQNRLAFLRSLESSDDLLTVSSLEISGKKLPGTVANWLAAYVDFALKPADRRSTLEQVKFLRTYSYAVSLRDIDRQKLANLIKLFNWLHDPVVNQKDLQELGEGPAVSSGQYLSFQQEALPENLVKPEKAVPPVVPAPKIPEPFDKPLPVSRGLGAAAISKTPPAVPFPQGQTPAAKVGMNEISSSAELRPGLVISPAITGDQQPPPVVMRGEAQENEKSKRIDQKLNDLENRLVKDRRAAGRKN